MFDESPHVLLWDDHDSLPALVVVMLLILLIFVDRLVPNTIALEGLNEILFFHLANFPLCVESLP